MWKQFSTLIVSLSSILAASPLRADSVVINELMYHPPSTNLLEQWFEIQNTGTNTADLSGWRAHGDVEFVFPTNTTLGPGGYLVVAAHATDVCQPASDRDQRRLRLDRRSQPSPQAGRCRGQHGQQPWISTARAIGRCACMGAVQYNHQGWEWYAEHDGLGKSLELVNAALPNTYAHNWSSSTVAGGTPGRANSVASTNTAPFITEVAPSADRAAAQRSGHGQRPHRG